MTIQEKPFARPGEVYNHAVSQLPKSIESLLEYLTQPGSKDRAVRGRRAAQVSRTFSNMAEVIEYQGGAQPRGDAKFFSDLQATFELFQQHLRSYPAWTETDKMYFILTVTRGFAKALSAYLCSEAEFYGSAKRNVATWMEFLVYHLPTQVTSQEMRLKVFEIVNDLLVVSQRPTQYGELRTTAYRTISLAAHAALDECQQAELLNKAFRQHKLHPFDNERNLVIFIEHLAVYRHLLWLQQQGLPTISTSDTFWNKAQLKPGVNFRVFPTILAELQTGLAEVKEELLEKFADKLSNVRPSQTEWTIANIIDALGSESFPEVQFFLMKTNLQISSLAQSLFRSLYQVCAAAEYSIDSMEPKEVLQILQIFKDLLAIDPDAQEGEAGFAGALLPEVDSRTKLALQSHNHEVNKAAQTFDPITGKFGTPAAFSHIEADHMNLDEFVSIPALYRALTFELHEADLSHCLLLGTAIKLPRRVGMFAYAALRLPIDHPQRSHMLILLQQLLRSTYDDPDDADDSLSEKYFGRIKEIILEWYMDKEHPDFVKSAK